MDIGRGNGASKRETIPIDQSTQLIPVYLFIIIIAGRSPPFCWDTLRIRRTVREMDTETAEQFPVRKISDFPCLSDLIPGAEQVEEDCLVHFPLA